MVTISRTGVSRLLGGFRPRQSRFLQRSHGLPQNTARNAKIGPGKFVRAMVRRSMSNGGGLLQLVALGAQNTHVLDPNGFSFFRQVYRRHKNFAVESIPQVFTGEPGYGRRMTCTLARKGDLVTGLMAEITLRRAAGDDFYPAEHLLREIELEIGGTRIDLLTNTWLRIYDQLHRSVDEREAYRSMADFDDSDSLGLVKRFYVPIPFWFSRNDPSQALPLISLPYHEVKVYLTMEDSANIPGIDPDFMPEVRLWADYVFLDHDERRWFAQTKHQYLIDQVQYSRESISFDVDRRSYNFTLNFNHPVKYLAWVARPNAESHGIYSSSLSGMDYEEVYGPLDECCLRLNGVERFQKRKGSYFRSYHPWTVFRQIPPVGIYVYSFALNPKCHGPSGSLNMSRIDTCRLELSTKKATLDSATEAVTEYETTTGAQSLKILEVYALNHNVLRIDGGMAGLVYT